jgi:hypothetical protein
MALRALRTVAGEVSPFEHARARWAAATAARRALRDRLDGAKAALVLADHKPAPGEYLAPVIEDRARRYLNGRRPDRERLLRQLGELEAELADAAAAHAIEAAAWRMALEAEAARRAEQARPRHRSAVRKIAQLVEQPPSPWRPSGRSARRWRRSAAARCPMPAVSSAA